MARATRSSDYARGIRIQAKLRGRAFPADAGWTIALGGNVYEDGV